MKPVEKIKEILENPELKWTHLGDVFLEHGGVVVCDPLADFYSRNRVQRTFPPGVYPVSVLEVDHPTFGKRYAYAQLVLSEDAVKKIILARFGLQNAFFVDSGLACFMDILTCNKYIEFVSQQPKEGWNLYDDLVREHFKANSTDESDGNWANFTIPGTENNIIMFQSGLGDGMYKAYLAIGKGDRPTRLIIDFDLERF